MSVDDERADDGLDTGDTGDAGGVGEVPVLDAELLPEVVAELATSSEDHTRALDVLATRHGAVSAAVDDLKRGFKILEGRLLEQADQTKPSRWAWEFLTRDEAAQLWTETRWFVDSLIRRYPLSSEVSIPPCWYRHPLAVDELSDVYAAWREAHCGDDTPSSSMIAWRDRWLWPSLHRLASYADWRECKEHRGHVEPVARQVPTDDDDFEAHVRADLNDRPDTRPADLPWPTQRQSSK